MQMESEVLDLELDEDFDEELDELLMLISTHGGQSSSSTGSSGSSHGSGSTTRTHGSGSTTRTHGSGSTTRGTHGSGCTTRGTHGCLTFLVLLLGDFDLLGDELLPLHGLERLKTGVLLLLQLLASVVTASTATNKANKITTRILMCMEESLSIT